jgi:hypothetical protein
MRRVGLLALLALPAVSPLMGGSLSGTFAEVPAGSDVDLTAEGKLDWVHWGLLNETDVNRKVGVMPQISDFTLVDQIGAPFAFWLFDNVSGYSWSDGTPTANVRGTTTGVWAFSTPSIGTGFELSVPADTVPRTLKVYVGSFAARGRFQASLSDGSSRAYSNNSLFNTSNGPNGVYTLTYAADSPNQTLNIRWTLLTLNRPDGNVTLHGAALTSDLANSPPFVELTAPEINENVALGSTLRIMGTATDLDGTVEKLEFLAGETLLGEQVPGSDEFSFSWRDAPVGIHLIRVRATDDQGSESSSKPVEVFVHGTGGSVASELVMPPDLSRSINLTAQGTLDWIHWGTSTNSPLDRKAGVLQLISDYTKIGPAEVQRYADNYTGFSWTDGKPTLNAADTRTGVFTIGLGNGFEVRVPADPTPRVLKIYVGLYGAQANFQAWLSDFSAPAYTDTTLSNFYASAYGVYTLTYSSSSPGQSLTVRHRPLQLFDNDFGNVTLQAATLVGEGFGPEIRLQDPSIEGAGYRFSFLTGAGQNYRVEYSQALGSGAWQVLTNVAGNGALAEVWDPNGGAAGRFYRVSLE